MLLYWRTIHLFRKDVMESLILAQDERWRHALHMQVERGSILVLVADGWVTRKNLPLGEGYQLETVVNTSYAEEWNGVMPPRDELASD